ncbi:MAG: GntR family transcriptional regulator [Vicinamibacteria bacterium]
MQIALNRRAPTPLREQLTQQLELRILEGDFPEGSKLPSIRSFARLLGIHRNTVASAYRSLLATRHVVARKRIGLFVVDAATADADEARPTPDEAVGQALDGLARAGHEPANLRAAVQRWLSRAPVRVVVLDPRIESAEVLAHEVGEATGLPTSASTFDDLRSGQASLDGALTVVLPYHERRLHALAPAAPCHVIHLDLTADCKAILAVPDGGLVLVVSYAPYVLTFARSVVHSLRGEAVQFQGLLLGQAREWQTLVRAADLVFADAFSFDSVRRANRRAVRPLSLASKRDLVRIRYAVVGWQGGPGRDLANSLGTD